MGTMCISSVSVQTWSGWRLGLNQDRGFSGRAGWREGRERVMSVCRTTMYHDGEVQGDKKGSKDLEGRLRVVEWWGHVLEVLMKFNGSWSQHVGVIDGEKEIPTVKVSEVVAGDVVLGGAWLAVAGDRSRWLYWGRTWWKPLLILMPLLVVYVTPAFTRWVISCLLQWYSFRLNLLEA